MAGKDVNWDLLNYHYYLPYELLAGRLEQDFFAASAQSYLNPVGYLFFYWMVASGWHSVIVSVVLALAHAVGLSLLFVLAWRLFVHLAPRERVVFASLATALGAATGVFWPTVGTSFLDPLLVPPMLGGLILLVEPGARSTWRATAAGALFGAAAALKYSNAIYAVAAFPLALTIPGLAAGQRLRAGLGYVAGGIAGLAVFAGPWFVLMIREFGNPVFPLMNGWFRSPDAPAVNLVSLRFTPEGLTEALSLPFRMVALDRSLYSETFAPDIRFAALLACVVAVPAVAFARGGSRGNALRGLDWRVLTFFAAGTALWLASSANGRYGMVIMLLAGVALARLAERVLPARVARIVLVVLLAVQVGMSLQASPRRWFVVEPWSRHWLPYDVPERAKREPALYLTLELLPMAVVAPFVNESSSFVNLQGQHTLAADSPRLAKLLARHRGNVRVLGRRLLLSGGKPPTDAVHAYDVSLRRIGYRVDTRDCFAIRWQRDDQDMLSRAANRLARIEPSPEPLSVASCALVPVQRDPRDVQEERRASALFERIERRCPGLLHGQTAVTEPFGSSGWSRNYGGLDARLETYGGRVVLDRYRAGSAIDLGSVADWEAERMRLPEACRRSNPGNK